jgi:hypothetical protein
VRGRRMRGERERIASLQEKEGGQGEAKLIERLKMIYGNESNAIDTLQTDQKTIVVDKVKQFRQSLWTWQNKHKKCRVNIILIIQKRVEVGYYPPRSNQIKIYRANK